MIIRMAEDTQNGLLVNFAVKTGKVAFWDHNIENYQAHSSTQQPGLLLCVR